MSINIGETGYRAYGMSTRQVEASKARQTTSEETMMRIAQNSDERLVLMNLAMNDNITEEVVNELFSRDQPELSKRLINLGYEPPSTLSKIIDFIV